MILVIKFYVINKVLLTVYLLVITFNQTRFLKKLVEFIDFERKIFQNSTKKWKNIVEIPKKTLLKKIAFLDILTAEIP